MFQLSDRDPVSIESSPIYGPRFGIGMLGLVALFAFGLGVAAGGVILPFLRSATPASINAGAAPAGQAQNRQALLSALPQTIFAELDSTQGPVSTNLSVEHYTNDLEVRASQAGYKATRSFQSLPTGAEIGYVFKARPDVKSVTTRLPETLVLKFQTGAQAGTLVLTEVRRDGVALSAGQRFADLVRAGATSPALPPTQLLTSRGLIEIKTTDLGAAAYLDGVLIYPGQTQAKGQAAALLPTTAKVDSNRQQALIRPQDLSIQAVWPQPSGLPDVAVLVASDLSPKPCSARVIVLDLKRGTRIGLAERLRGKTLRAQMIGRGLTMGGFCASSPAVKSAGEESASQDLAAVFDTKTGLVRWEVAKPMDVPLPPPNAQKWREPSPNRIASPLGQQGALASVACRVGGGYTIAASGLPSPAKGTKATVRVASGGKATNVQMNWKPSANGYEVDGTAEKLADDPVLALFGVGQPLEFSAQGATMTIAAPQAAQVANLLERCKKPPAN